MGNLPNVQGPVNISVPKTLTTVTSCEAMALHVAPLEWLGMADSPEGGALSIWSTPRAVVAAEGTPHFYILVCLGNVNYNDSFYMFEDHCITAIISQVV